jgi:hypothetical protein
MTMPPDFLGPVDFKREAGFATVCSEGIMLREPRNPDWARLANGDGEFVGTCLGVDRTLVEHCNSAGRLAFMIRIPSRIALCIPLAFSLAAQDRPTAVFGTTVVIPGGLKGDIYHLQNSTRSLAGLTKLKPVGSIYSSMLDVRPQDFSLGFPGVTDRFEWFAIDYSGRFWIEHPGIYRFRLISDDGAMLYVDGQLIIDNDGVHSPGA